MALELNRAKQTEAEVVQEAARQVHLQQLVQQERERCEQLKDDLSAANVQVL